jgi:hypothetical protein
LLLAQIGIARRSHHVATFDSTRRRSRRKRRRRLFAR